MSWPTDIHLYRHYVKNADQSSDDFKILRMTQIQCMKQNNQNRSECLKVALKKFYHSVKNQQSLHVGQQNLR